MFLEIGIIDASVVSSLAVGGQNFPVPPNFKALVDTGAEATMISPNVAQTVGLTAIGQMPIQGVGHTVTYHNAYLFHVAFVVPAYPIGQPPGAASRSMVFVLPTPIYGAEITSTRGAFDVLLGMDVISTGSLKVEGDGHFSFSF